MLRWIIAAAILFWVTLLGLALKSASAGNYPVPESLWLVGIPAAMIVVTIITKSVAKDRRLAPGAIAGGSITAGFAVLMWIGILGAGV
jgi:hypothetical protein